MLINVSFSIKYETLSHTWYIDNLWSLSCRSPINHLGILFLKRNSFHQHTYAMMLAHNINITCCLTTIVKTTSDTRICHILSNHLWYHFLDMRKPKTLEDHRTGLRTITQVNLNIISSSKTFDIYKSSYLYVTQHPFFYPSFPRIWHTINNTMKEWPFKKKNGLF